MPRIRVPRFVERGAAAAALLATMILAWATTIGEGADMQMAITSSAFDQSGKIPRRFTCEGDDVSPPLAWSGVPDGTRSLVLIVDDPDAPDPANPRMTWVHWVLYDIPSTAAGLAEDVVPAALPPGTRQGTND